jgi:hypothetical protein
VSNTVTRLACSHDHADHGGAAALLDEDVVRVGHEETRRLLVRGNDPARPAPEVTFQDTYPLEAGSERAGWVPIYNLNLSGDVPGNVQARPPPCPTRGQPSSAAAWAGSPAAMTCRCTSSTPPTSRRAPGMNWPRWTPTSFYVRYGENVWAGAGPGRTDALTHGMRHVVPGRGSGPYPYRIR